MNYPYFPVLEADALPANCSVGELSDTSSGRTTPSKSLPPEWPDMW